MTPPVVTYMSMSTHNTRKPKKDPAAWNALVDRMVVLDKRGEQKARKAPAARPPKKD